MTDWPAALAARESEITGFTPQQIAAGLTTPATEDAVREIAARRLELARQVGFLTASINGAIGELCAGSPPTDVAAMLRRALADYERRAA